MELKCPKCNAPREVTDTGLREFCQCTECHTIFPREPLPESSSAGCIIGCLAILAIPVVIAVIAVIVAHFA